MLNCNEDFLDESSILETRDISTTYEYEQTETGIVHNLNNACPQCNLKFLNYDNLVMHFEECYMEAIEMEAMKIFKYIFFFKCIFIKGISTKKNLMKKIPRKIFKRRELCR